jgi:hypothetical protein
MALVFTATDTLTCSHAAPLVMTPAAKLTVGGSTGVLTLKSVLNATIPACTGTPPSPGGVKCTKASVTSGQAAKLSVGGDFVVLQGLVVATNGNPIVVTAVPGPPSKLSAV